MANIKSSKKRIKVNEKKALANKMIKSALKTTIKKFEEAVAGSDKELATENYKNTVKALDMAVSKNVLHINKASRKKSRLSSKLKAMA